MKCQICGTALGDDLFSAVTGEKVCSICKVKFIGGLSTTPERIAQARERLGLKPGEHINQDRAAEAANLLGRNRR